MWNTGSAPTGTPLKSTIISYASLGNYIYDRVSCIQVTAGTAPSSCGTVTSNTKSLTNNTYFSNGNLETTSSWVQGASYLNRSYAYYANGLIETATDVNSSVSTPSYQNCNTTTPTPAYVSSITAGGLTTSYVWDCNGGVPTEISMQMASLQIMAMTCFGEQPQSLTLLVTLQILPTRPQQPRLRRR